VEKKFRIEERWSVSAMVQRKLKKKLSRPMAIGRETTLVHGVTNHSFKA
jgi:hypothetical protein